MNILEILEQMPFERRQYTLLRLAQHLFDAQEWSRLFVLLDMHQYGRAKLRYDPSTFSYTQDLDLGRQAAMWSGWQVQEGVAQLPRLWRYTLLRCSLAHRVDRYPKEAFRLLVLLGRKQEALQSVEVLTNQAEQAGALLQIAEQLREQGNQEGGVARGARESHRVSTCAAEAPSVETS